MTQIPLLPRTKGQEWPPQTAAGLHPISEVDYQRYLCEDYFAASDFGTPSPLAHPLVFADRLQLHLEDLRRQVTPPRFADHFDRWAMLVRGLYFGILTVERVDLATLGSLGTVLASSSPASTRWVLLRLDGAVVGLTSTRVGVVPGVRVPKERFADLEARIRTEEGTSVYAAEQFARWATARSLDETTQGLFTDLLLELGRRWVGRDLPPLDEGERRAFEPGLELIVSAGRDRTTTVVMVRYIGTPITCGHCGEEIGREAGGKGGPFLIRRPDDCRCPRCDTPQPWLDEHASWLRFNVERDEYLIYGFAGSPFRDASYPTQVHLEGDGALLTNGRFAMKVVGAVLTEERLKCDRLTFFHNGAEEARPVLPVKGEYFDLVSVAPGGARQVGPTGDYRVTLRVEGWEDPVRLRFSQDEIHHDEALALLWPNFRREGWNRYFYLLEVHEPLRQANAGLRLLRQGSAPQLLEGSRGVVEQAFDAVEVVFRPGNTGILEHAGVFKPVLEPIGRGRSPVTLAVDFGTSATTIWSQVGEASPRPIRFTDHTATLIPNDLFSARVVERSFWLPTYRLNDPRMAAEVGATSEGSLGRTLPPDRLVKQMSWFLPSELVVRRSPTAEGLGEPVRDFQLCHPYGIRPGTKDVLYEIKSLPPQGTPDGRFRFPDLVENYLEVAALLAVASVLDHEPQAGVLKLRTAFPRAFSSAKLEGYIGAFDRAFERVKELTGFDSLERLFLDESRAAAYAIRAGGQPALVMDMGGGTTDIGIFEWRKGSLYPLLLDSLQYGGNDFLRLLVKERQLFPRPALQDVDWMLWLIREVRLGGFEEVVRAHYSADQAARERAIRLLVRFFEPILYYVRRLFDALARRGQPLAERKLAVYLMGNGWSLAQAIPLVDSNLGADYREVFQTILQGVGFPKAEVLIQPAGIAEWPGPKAAVALGMLRAENLLRDLGTAAIDHEGIQTIVGFDIEIDDGSGGVTPVAWDEEIPLSLADEQCAPLLGGLTLPAEWDFIHFDRPEEIKELERQCRDDVAKIGGARLTRSVLARFIEQVYLGQLPGAVRS